MVNPHAGTRTVSGSGAAPETRSQRYADGTQRYADGTDLGGWAARSGAKIFGSGAGSEPCSPETSRRTTRRAKTDIGPVWLRVLRPTLWTVAPEPVTVREPVRERPKSRGIPVTYRYAYRHWLRSGSGDPEPTVR